jgi:hypothetical protein
VQFVVDKKVAGEADFCGLSKARRISLWIPCCPRVKYKTKTARKITNGSLNKNDIDAMLISVSVDPVSYDYDLRLGVGLTIFVVVDERIGNHLNVSDKRRLHIHNAKLIEMLNPTRGK